MACKDFINTFGKYLNFSHRRKNFKRADAKFAKAAGATVIRLNGCVCCKKHVYMPQDKDTHCPLVKADGTVCGHARYDAKGKPFEVRSSLFFWYDLGCVAFFTHSSLSVLVRHFYSLITFIFVVWND